MAHCPLPTALITIFTDHPQSLDSSIPQSLNVQRCTFPLPFTDHWSALHDLDTLIIGGGGLLFNYSRWKPGSAASCAWNALLAKRNGAQVVFLGIGAGPIRNPIDRWLTHLAVQQADHVLVRDPESAVCLRKLGVTREIQVGTDLAWGVENAVILSEAVSFGDRLNKTARLWRAKNLQILRRSASQDDSPLIGIALRPWKNQLIPGHPIFEAILQQLDLIISQLGARLIFFPFHAEAGMDVQVCETLRSRLAQPGRAEILPVPDHPSEMITRIKGLDALISMRYHGVLFAAKAECPVIGLIYDPKVERLMDQLEMPEFGIPLEEERLEFLEERVETLLKERERVRKQLQEKAAEAALRQGDLLKNAFLVFTDGGRQNL